MSRITQTRRWIQFSDTIFKYLTISNANLLQKRLIIVPLNRLVGWIRWSLLGIVRTCFNRLQMSKENDFSVLYHSENYLVINKHYDVVLNGEKHSVSIQKQLCRRFPQLADSNLTHHFRFVHRLDYSTSGALCVALNKKAAASAMAAFNKRITRKFYLALVRGHVIKEQFIVDKNIGHDSRLLYTHRMCTSDKSYCQNSREAITAGLVLQRGTFDGDAVTKLLLMPVTGRRHQLRVHCMEIGHKILGDFTYSDRKDILPFRMFLHAYYLEIPTKTEVICVTTNDPFDESELKNQWKPEVTFHKLGLSALEDLTEDVKDFLERRELLHKK